MNFNSSKMTLTMVISLALIPLFLLFSCNCDTDNYHSTWRIVYPDFFGLHGPDAYDELVVNLITGEKTKLVKTDDEPITMEINREPIAIYY